MPWLDPERCVLEVDAIHISTNVKRRSGKYTLTVNTAFDGVVAGCIEQHGESWLHPPMQKLLKVLNSKGYTGQKKLHFGIHSIELWDKDKRLVAGDLGYSVGAVYTSMTGFRKEGTVGAGTIQLVATCSLLKEQGFKWWDLGMVMKYKKELGAHVMSRKEFISRLHKDRDCSDVTLATAEHISAKHLVQKLRLHQQELLSSEGKRTCGGEKEDMKQSVAASATKDSHKNSTAAISSVDEED
mmetsp:Transcript_14484/g.29220  ORF Transcript_14484/g.29220 Transcript_14484/m.29220 type:complete len:241 (-) Transcript_14484:184-906(-)